MRIAFLSSLKTAHAFELQNITGFCTVSISFVEGLWEHLAVSEEDPCIG